MSPRLAPLRSAWMAFLLLAVAAGCGGLGAPRDGASHADADNTDVVPIMVDLAPDVSDAGSLSADVDIHLPDTDANADAYTILPTTDSGVGTETSAPLPVTVIILPDTQYYSASFPSVYLAQTNWIASQAKVRNIKAVLHVGDVVDTYDSAAQWNNASSAMRKLDGIVPYVLVPGNHDEYVDLNVRGTIINNYFAPNTMPWINGTFETGKIENNYALIDIGSHKYLVIGLEWGPRDSVLVWADAILKSYAAYPAIVVTHAFLDGNERYDWARHPSNGPDQYWNPHWYAEAYAAAHNVPIANVNDGEETYQKLILPNPNVRMVFSGHVLGDSTFGAVGRVTDVRSDGTHIHQMLSDYQVIPDPNSGRASGLGYLRILELDTVKREIRVRTYSPYLDQDLTLGDNTFTLPLDDF